MALNLNAAHSCKFLTLNINYPVKVSTQLLLSIENASGVDVSGSVNPLFTLTNASSSISYPIPVSELSISSGIITVIVKTAAGTEVDRKTVLLHCDIDCCLTKLTNELIECSCDCAKCASSLAKAQKILLLLKSADYAIVQGNDSEVNARKSSTRPGFILDANSKYLKAKEVCDDSCGCDC